MSLNFQNLAAFWLLLLIPVLLGLKLWGDARARRSVERLASPRLISSLLTGRPGRLGWVAFTLEALAFILLTAALARPQYGVIMEESEGRGRNIIIAIDTSKSMLANDLAPNRLERAKLAAEDLVKNLRGDRIGLMPFAGAAYMFAPLTLDADGVLDCIHSIDTEIIPHEGSNLSAAIEHGITTFEKANVTGQRAMVVFSDGEELQGRALEAARKARDARISLICVGAGTPQGAIIMDPNQSGGYFRDRDGKVVHSKLQKDALEAMARITDGLYLTLDSKGVSSARLEVILQKLQRSETKMKVTETAIERYRWPLCGGLISLLAAFACGVTRRHIAARALPVALAGLGVLLSIRAPAQAQGETPPAAAVAVEEPLLPPPVLDGKDGGEGEKAPETPPVAAPTPAEKPLVPGDAWVFYANGDWRNATYNFSREITDLSKRRLKSRYEEELDALQLARGAAAFKDGDFDQAIDAYGSALASDAMVVRQKAHYNLANTIYTRAKTAEIQRATELTKAKKKRDKKRWELSLSYLDKTIRQLENSLEHYQEALALNFEDSDATKNHDLVEELIKKLRDIRQQKAQQGQGKGEGQGKSKSKGQGEGEGEGEGEG